MRVNNWLKKATEELNKSNSTSAALDAEVLLSFVINKPREYILIHPEYYLNTQQLTTLNNLLKRRVAGEPIAYLINKKEFFGLEFYIDQNVLVPRPETELLVETVLDKIKDSSTKTIADIGTGSGCIAISIAKNSPGSEIIATDISEKSLIIAKRNADKHKVLNRIAFVQNDLLEGLSSPVDIIIANLPYLPRSEYKKEISFEPEHALFGEEKGLYYIEKLLRQSPALLKNHGFIILEIHPPQSSKIEKIAKGIFPEAIIQIAKDLSDKDRFVLINK